MIYAVPSLLMTSASREHPEPCQMTEKISIPIWIWKTCTWQFSRAVFRMATDLKVSWGLSETWPEHSVLKEKKKLKKLLSFLQGPGKLLGFFL